MAAKPRKTNPTLTSRITILEGLGPKTAEAFARLGVITLEDMFFLMPRRYEDRRNPKPMDSLVPGTTDCAVGMVSELSYGYGKTEAVISDSTGSANIIWFTEKIGTFLRKGMRIAVYGQLSDRYIVPSFSHPEFEILKRGAIPKLIGKIFPVYPGTADLTQRVIIKFIDLALDKYSEECLKEFLPKKVLNSYKMMSFRDAVIQIHRPSDELSFIKARNRLSFDEFYLLQTDNHAPQHSRRTTAGTDPNSWRQVQSFHGESALCPHESPAASRSRDTLGLGQALTDEQTPTRGRRLRENDCCGDSDVSGVRFGSAIGVHGTDGDSCSAALHQSVQVT